MINESVHAQRVASLATRCRGFATDDVTFGTSRHCTAWAWANAHPVCDSTREDRPGTTAQDSMMWHLFAIPALMTLCSLPCTVTYAADVLDFIVGAVGG